MIKPDNEIDIRNARETDRPFIFSLSPILARVACLNWHEDDIIQSFQDSYIDEMLEKSEGKQQTLIAERSGVSLGFIHARASKDSISGEECCTVPLLAVLEEAQGTGVGRLLMETTENWARQQGYRLLHLEVFSANKQAQSFYQCLGFRPESINMIKPLS